MNMTYLITGATGNIGRLVVDGLLARGVKPRVFVRSADKARAVFAERVDAKIGDLADPASLSSALTGVDALFLVNTGPELAHRDAAAAQVALAAGVRSIVKLSSMDVQRDGGAVGAWHAQGEAAIAASGVAYTFVRPAGFMSNALAWAVSIKQEGVVRAPTEDGAVAMIHPRDIAAVACEALCTRDHDRTSLAITGPVALSYAEMTATISQAIGKPIEFICITDAEALERLIAGGAPPPVAQALVSLWQAVRRGEVASVTHTVETVLKRAPIAFEAWAEGNRAAFM
jgi:uncharacterized protein YbjT (DUF2867 family)